MVRSHPSQRDVLKKRRFRFAKSSPFPVGLWPINVIRNATLHCVYKERFSCFPSASTLLLPEPQKQATTF